MNIQEMHTVFRTLGQQMGMQLNRGILAESIDVYLNDVIIEITQEKLIRNVHTALQEQTTTQASTMEGINAFRNLYKVSRYELDTTDVGNLKKVLYYNNQNGYHILNIPVKDSNIEIIPDIEAKISPLMYLGFSVEYENILRGNAIACRMIGSDVLETTLRDMCNGASKDAPIVSLSSIITSDDVKSNEQLELFTNTKDCKVKYLNIKYIKVPNIVKYDMDTSKMINCDLPAYLHYNIVERAVNKYYQSIGGNIDNNKRN